MKAQKLIQLKAGEEVMAVVHEDLVPKFPKLGLLFLWFVIPFFFLFSLINQGTLGLIIFILLVFSALFAIVKFFIKWGNTLLIITDRRVVDINQKALFEREITETPFSLIDEVSYRISGFVPTILRLGIIRLRTTGESADIEFSRVRKPQKIHDLIQDLRNVIKDDGIDSKVERVKEIAEKLSDKEIDAVHANIKRKERKQAVERIFIDDDENPFKVRRKKHAERE